MRAIKRKFLIFYIIFILIFITGCGTNKKELTIDDKISSEVEFLDSKISENMSKLISNMEAGETLKIEEEKSQKDVSGSKKSENQGSSGENQGDSEETGDTSKKKGSDEEQSGEESKKSSDQEKSKEGSEESSEGNESEKNSSKQTNMSVQYSQTNMENSINWDQISKNVQEISSSWNVIESDLLTKQALKQSDFDNVKNSIDNLISDSSNQDRESTIKNSAEFFNGLCVILDKIDYDKDKYDTLRIKQYIYESYYNVIGDNWDNVRINIETANTKIQNMNNTKEENKIAFANLLSSAEKKDKKAFLVRCSDALDRL